MNYQEFLEKIVQIKDMGYIQSRRKGPTGIGKTLEDLLGIKENNIPGPDFPTYELKSGRKNSSSMLTLFTKTPQPDDAIIRLLEVFGYQQRKAPISYKQITLNGENVETKSIPLREKELHSTIDSEKKNSLNLKIAVHNGRISIENDKNVDAYWDNAILRKAFEKKYDRLVYVLADNKIENKKECFWYNEAFRLQGFSFERFSELVKKGKLKVDLRIGHHPDGRLHDHGTGFRIMPKYLPQCFEVMERIL